MKSFSFCIVLLWYLVVPTILTAQTKNSHIDRLPWVNGEFPKKTGEYEYYVTRGESSTLKEAREDAFTNLLFDLGNKAGVNVSSQSLGEMKSSLDYNAGSQSYEESSSYLHNYKIERDGLNASFIKVSEYYEIVNVGDRKLYNLWELYQVSLTGTEFKPYIPEYTYYYGSKALLRSTFLPGWGQFYKKKPIKGAIFLAAEAGLLTGVFFSEMRRSDNARKSQETTNLQLTKEYRKNMDKCETTRNLFIGGTVAVYALNLIDAALAKGQIRYAWLPENIDLSSFEQNEIIYIGLTYKF